MAWNAEELEVVSKKIGRHIYQIPLNDGQVVASSIFGSAAVDGKRWKV